MATTTLRAYLDELDVLLRNEALEEVVGHCRHILQHFPKNIETYRILGRALLKRRQYDEADDVFQRVLSAIPDDYVSHRGLCTVAEEKGQLASAISHLERAFEQTPNDGQLQDLLKQLYERRDGKAPASIPMTRGALARVYVKSELYDQAITELQAALGQNTNRTDLWLLLATSLWHNQRKIEAGEAALQVLDSLPDALEANHILAALWLESGRPSDAREYVSTMEQLDPFLAWRTVHPDGKPLPPTAFQLPHLDWNAQAAAALVSNTPDWVSQIGTPFDNATPFGSGTANWMAEGTPPPAEETIEPPDWLADVERSTAMPAPGMEFPASEVPDWFKDVPAVGSSEIEPPTFSDFVPAAPGDDQAAAPVWDTDLSAPPEPAATEPVDPMAWLQTGPLTPPEPATEPTVDPMSWLQTGPLPPPESVVKPEAPDPMSWLQTGPLNPPPEVEQTSAGGESTPSDQDWLSAMDQAPGVTSGEPASAAAEPVELPSDLDWLSASSGSEATAQPAAEQPDWLSAMDQAPGVTSGEPASAAAEPLEPPSDLDWLSASTEQASAPAEAAPVGEDLGWLSESEQPESGLAPVADSAADEMGWLSELPAVEDFAATPEETPAEASTSIPDWLSAMKPPEPAADQALPETADAPTGLTDLLNAQAAAPEPVAADDLDWLSAAPELLEPAEMTDEAALPAEALPSVEEFAAEVPATPSADDLYDVMNALRDSVGPMTVASTEQEDAASLDWMSGEAGAPASGPLPDDWLDNLAASTPPAPAVPTQPEMPVEPAAPAPEPALDLSQPELSDFDWMADEPTGMTGLFAEATPGSDMGAGGSKSESRAVNEASAAPDSGDWQTRTGMTGLFSDTQPAPENPMAWLNTQAADSAPGEVPPAPAEVDPLAWLRPYQQTPETADAAVTPDSSADALDWLNTPAEAEPAQPGSAQDDWLGAMGEAPAPETEPTTVPVDLEPQAAEPPQPEEPPEPRLHGLTSRLATISTPSESGASETGELPDWMRGLEPIAGVETPADQLPESSSTLTPTDETGILEPSQTPDWLSALTDEAAAQPSEETTADWLSAAGPAEEAAYAETSLEFVEIVAGAEVEPAVANEELPDWLSAMAQGESPAPEAESASGAEPVGAAADLDNLENLDLGAEVEPAVANEELPDWLAAIDLGASAASEAEPASEGALAGVTADLNLADLGALDLGEEAEPAVEGEAVPDWLAAMDLGQTRVTPASRPASESDSAGATADLNFDDLGDLGMEAEPAAPAAGGTFDLDLGHLGEAESEGDMLPDWLGGTVVPDQANVPVAPSAIPVDTNGGRAINKYTFDRPPVWLRHKSVGASAGQVSAPTAATREVDASPREDIPDWLQRPVDLADEPTDDDLPDWLKE
ncbi:MAG TPA: tetratricopeptide repeat protein [Aggregatilineales bacterium]|nr:tetratricopeptide repeat protein [Aggregatilineales bacterium]